MLFQVREELDPLSHYRISNFGGGQGDTSSAKLGKSFDRYLEERLKNNVTEQGLLPDAHYKSNTAYWFLQN